VNPENNTVEKLILQNLILNEEYSRKTVPFLHADYFHDIVEKTLFKSVQDFILEYGNRPTKEAIVISLDGKKNLTQDQFNDCVDILNDLCDSFTEQDDEWLYEKSEKFCKDKAVYNAIMDSIQIIDGKNETRTENAIPEILSEALSVSFDTHIGHDYIEDADERYEFYHKTESKIPFDLEMFNTITQGGTPKKTLNMILAGTGVGKSLFMCHHAAACLSQNNNVLYITCEMAEERIAERIDANLMDITMDDMKALPKQIYDKKLETATQGCTGKLIVKEYPTATAHVNHFRALLDELKLKKKFIPDIIFIDYLNICASSRMKQNANVNSYTYIKAIAEELRGLAVERNVPVFSATQTNRSGFNNSDVGLEDTSESFGLPATADLMFALISTEELEEQNQIMVKQLKNRYNDVVTNKKFVLGITRAKMKLFDVDPNEQTGLVDTNLTEDTEYGNGFGEDSFKQKFAGWNV
jgi:replicative DNA helicase